MSAKDFSAAAKTAVAVGSVSEAAEAAAERAMRLAEKAGNQTGIQVRNLGGARAFLVQVLIDDSGSMRGFETAVQDAFAKLVYELREAAAEASGTDILISVTLLNRGQIQTYVPVGDCLSLTGDNYRCDGGTPLYGGTIQTLGTLLSKVRELVDSGRTGQSFTCIISDGRPTDGIVDEHGNSRPKEEGRVFDPRDIARLIGGMTETKQNIVCGVSIGGEASDTFGGMGINPRWILDPARDSFAFDAALKQVSRASRSASKGAGEFQRVASDGFR